jgi:hypothetical protein
MNAKAKRVRELQDFQGEQQFHEREWRVQRVGWALLSLLILAGLAGVFGGGPLARQSINSEYGQIESERFARRHSVTEWAITYRQNQNTSDSLTIAIDADYLHKFEVREITPEPDATQVAQGEVLFSFNTLGPSGRVLFHVEPQRPGIAEGSFRLNDSPALVVKQIIYP